MATLSISFTIADGAAAGIKDDFAASLGWKSTIPDPNNPGQTISNPETQNAFIKRKIGEYIKENVKSYRVSQDVETARTTAITTAESEVVLT